MKKHWLILFYLTFVFLSCKSQEREYSFDEFFSEFQESFDFYDIPLTTYFWNEFSYLEPVYNLTENESKLLGRWIDVSFTNNPYNSYSFFPNKLFIIKFSSRNYILNNKENLYLNKAFGTWEINKGIVQVTVYSIMTEDAERRFPYNKDVIILENPYTFDFIHIDHIGKEGFTKRPINTTIFSKELEQTVTVNKPNTTNNLYVRNVYTIDFIPRERKNYDYFTNFPEMAENKHSGLEIATNPELIKRYIPDTMF